PALQNRHVLRTFRVDDGFVAQSRIQDARMTVRVFEDRMQGRGHLVFQRRALADMLADVGVELLARVFHEGKEAGALVGEVQIEGAVTQARFARDVLWTRRMVTALDEELPRRLLDLGKAFRLAPGASNFGDFRTRAHWAKFRLKPRGKSNAGKLPRAVPI